MKTKPCRFSFAKIYTVSYGLEYIGMYIHGEMMDWKCLKRKVYL